MDSTGLVALCVFVFIAVAQWRLRVKMTAEHRDALTLKVRMLPVLNICSSRRRLASWSSSSAASWAAQVLTSSIDTGVPALFWPIARIAATNET